MIKKILLVLVLMCLALPCFAKSSTQEEVITPLTQLEKRQFQTRTYRATDKPTVMKALLNVYQDEDFMIYNANPLLGFIYGSKDFDTSDPDVDISKEFGLSESTLANIFKRGTMPSISTLDTICNSFGITLSQFFCENEMVELSPELKELFEGWTSLTKKQKEKADVFEQEKRLNTSA